MELNYVYSKKIESFEASQIKELQNHLINTTSRDDIGFLSELENPDHYDSSLKIFQHFKNKKKFFHIGIGGSSLGPEMLINALKKESDVDFTFVNNIDPDEINDQIKRINHIEESLFYIVSKSGGTSETIAAAMIIFDLLENKFHIPQDQFKNYVILCTDPQNGDLRKLSKHLDLHSLEVPPSIGGRFSVLSPVGILPGLFAGLDMKKMIGGAHHFGKNQLNSREEVVQTALQLEKMRKDENVTQTVLMPYSSKLKSFSSWFVQLWAESLGKKNNLNNQEVHVGFTPIQSYGATDQHSQMQLFVEGPTDKAIFLLSIKEFAQEVQLKSSIDLPSFSALNGFSLNQLMEAEFFGAKQTLIDQNKPVFHMEIKQLNEKSLGELIMFFELLTVAQGHLLKINPFDQPGVESGKIYTKKWLNKEL